MKKTIHSFQYFFCLCILSVTIFIGRSTLAQGGAPMITDDSDTPGDGKWENNVGFIFEGSKNDYRKTFPFIDINYGVGEHIQLKAELNWVAEKGDNLANKFDNITLGFKYSFLDEKEAGFSLSVYPQPIISFNSEDGVKSTAFGVILPAAISKEIAGFGCNFQAGFQVLGKKSELFFGLCIEREIGETFTLLGELHSTFGRTKDLLTTGDEETFFKAGTFINLGTHIKLSEDYIILAAIGKDIESAPISSADANFYGFIGLQLKM